jgi:hypothetical protein
MTEEQKRLAAMTRGERCDWIYERCKHCLKDDGTPDPHGEACDYCTEQRLAALRDADVEWGKLLGKIEEVESFYEESTTLDDWHTSFRHRLAELRRELEDRP